MEIASVISLVLYLDILGSISACCASPTEDNLWMVEGVVVSNNMVLVGKNNQLGICSCKKCFSCKLLNMRLRPILIIMQVTVMQYYSEINHYAG